MGVGKVGLVAASLMLLGLAGCQSDRFSPSAGPAPLPAAPSGRVVSSQLPPPAVPPIPEAPTMPENSQQVAGLDPNAGMSGAASGPAVTEGSVAGVWNVNVSGQTCRVATPRTKFGQGYRAAPLRCPAPLDGVKSWKVQGSQVILFDQDGGTLASLNPAGPEKFNGSTSNGTSVSLSR